MSWVAGWGEPHTTYVHSVGACTGQGRDAGQGEPLNNVVVVFFSRLPARSLATTHRYPPPPTVASACSAAVAAWHDVAVSVYVSPHRPQASVSTTILTVQAVIRCSLGLTDLRSRLV